MGNRGTLPEIKKQIETLRREAARLRRTEPFMVSKRAPLLAKIAKLHSKLRANKPTVTACPACGHRFAAQRGGDSKPVKDAPRT